jgi:hypothetical protein
MRNIELFFYLFLLVFFQDYSFAKDTYFDFILPSKLILISYEYKVVFKHLISGAEEKDFTIKPIMENGLIEIFESEKNIWIKQNDLRSSFPKLNSEMRIRIVSFGNYKSEICFEIQHIKTTALYKTPCKTYWDRASLGGYLSLINDRILKWNE